MNSLITKNGDYVGQYLHIKDSDFSVRMFTKFYNLSTQNEAFSIDKTTAKDLIHTGKYYGDKNKIYVNDPDTDKNMLKALHVGDYAVFIQDIKELYIFNKEEFEEFIKTNEYTTDVSVTYVLGIDNGVEFTNMRVILANNLDNAKRIYMDRYKTSEPICIGIFDRDHLVIYSDKYEFSVPLIM